MRGIGQSEDTNGDGTDTERSMMRRKHMCRACIHAQWCLWVPGDHRPRDLLPRAPTNAIGVFAVRSAAATSTHAAVRWPTTIAYTRPPPKGPINTQWWIVAPPTPR